MQANNNEIVDRVRMKQNVANYKKQMRQFILTSRFNNTTFNENREYRQRNNKIGCVYCSPELIAKHIPVDSILFILEMNNDTNKITGVGMIKNHPICNKYSVYSNCNYNRYVYVGKYRIDRSEMSEVENKVMQIFDILCFTGNRHMKRGQGLKSFPVDLLYQWGKSIDLVDFICKMFKGRIIN
jgi:hypothetical protein